MFKQTNNLQEAIDKVANKDQFGVPPMPPMEGEGVPADAPFATPQVEAAPEAAPSAEQILADSLETTPAQAPEAAPETVSEVAPEMSAPEVAPETAPEATPEVVPAMEDGPVIPEAPMTDIPAETTPEVAGDLASIRENVIRDLLPLMDKVDSTPEEKFEIYKDAMKTMHDAKTIEGAYKTATQIADETKKADALIGLMKTIDEA